MAKPKKIYTCQHCSAQTSQWAGLCTDCGAWNSIAEDIIVVNKNPSPRFVSFAGKNKSQVTTLCDVELLAENRFSTGSKEFDRVLGGG